MLRAAMAIEGSSICISCKTEGAQLWVYDYPLHHATEHGNDGRHRQTEHRAQGDRFTFIVSKRAMARLQSPFRSQAEMRVAKRKPSGLSLACEEQRRRVWHSCTPESPTTMHSTA